MRLSMESRLASRPGLAGMLHDRPTNGLRFPMLPVFSKKKTRHPVLRNFKPHGFASLKPSIALVYANGSARHRNPLVLSSIGWPYLPQDPPHANLPSSPNLQNPLAAPLKARSFSMGYPSLPSPGVECGRASAQRNSIPSAIIFSSRGPADRRVRVVRPAARPLRFRPPFLFLAPTYSRTLVRNDQGPLASEAGCRYLRWAFDCGIRVRPREAHASSRTARRAQRS